DLKGLAKKPSSVPNWVSQFKNEISLVGRTFDDVKIGRNDKDIVTFELKTREDKEK
ncbi:MSHA biogenesis protein MshI, partial [Vibrio alginolyticus]